MLYKKTCANCGAEFETNISNKIYCSVECRSAKNNKNRLKEYHAERAALPKLKKKCAHCGAEFETHNAVKIYCSEECLKKVTNIRRMEKYFEEHAPEIKKRAEEKASRRESRVAEFADVLGFNLYYY